MTDLRVAVLGLGMMGAFHVDVLSTTVKGVTITVVNDFVRLAMGSGTSGAQG